MPWCNAWIPSISLAHIRPSNSCRETQRQDSDVHSFVFWVFLHVSNDWKELVWARFYWKLYHTVQSLIQGCRNKIPSYLNWQWQHKHKPFSTLWACSLYTIEIHSGNSFRRSKDFKTDSWIYPNVVTREKSKDIVIHWALSIYKNTTMSTKVSIKIFFSAFSI